MAPNSYHHHVINQLTGEEMNENRNVKVESARIARGDIHSLSEITPADIDALVLPGGFGAAKNLSSWAFDGPEGTILPEVKLILVNMVNVGKPICALCVSPTLVAKAFENSSIHPLLTLGSDKESSEYDIEGFSDGIASVGSNPVMKSIKEIAIDEENKIVSAPCYMMEADIVEVRNNISLAIGKMIEMI
jgi:enhancing lycopene biosynthesis protein 2